MATQGHDGSQNKAAQNMPIGSNGKKFQSAKTDPHLGLVLCALA